MFGVQRQKDYCMDTAQWAQEMILAKPPAPPPPPTRVEETVSSSITRPPPMPQQLTERRARPPQKEKALNCPRCNSNNTKFCYYNNYSLTQPRYFCKTCRRYWTEGGTLRNVPVGGGSRKNKRPSSSSLSSSNPSSSLLLKSRPISASSASDANQRIASEHHHFIPSTVRISSDTRENPKLHHLEGRDLNLDCSFPQGICNPSTCSLSSSTTPAAPATELLRGGFTMINPFVPITMPATAQDGPFGGLQGFKSTNTSLAFPVDSVGGAASLAYCGGQNAINMQGELQEMGGGRVQLLPFEDLRQVSSEHQQLEQGRGQGADSSGFWNGVMGGAGGAAW